MRMEISMMVVRSYPHIIYYSSRVITHQYQSLTANMNGGVQRSVTCVVSYGDVSTIFQKFVNNPVLF